METRRRMSSKEMHGDVRALQRETRGSDRSVGDAADAADPECSASLVWEKRFHQTILVDINDDDSLHLSDLRDSFTVHVSQGSSPSRTVSFSESRGVSGSDEAEDSSEFPDSVSSSGRHHPRDREASAPPLDPAAEGPQQRNQDDDTSDEDQEELPYDGEPHCHHAVCPRETSRALLHSVCPTSAQDGGICHADPSDPNNPATGPESGQVCDSVPEFLLRYFSQEELLNCGRLIEAETLPEVSLLESVDETDSPPPFTDGPPTSTEGLCTKPCWSPVEEKESSKASETSDSSPGSAEAEPLRKSQTTEPLNSSGSLDQSNTSVVPRESCIGNAVEDEEGDEEMKEGDLCRRVVQGAQRSWEMARSSGELKYGQGQVHYPLPDFSKVASKIRIPKATRHTRSGSLSVAIDRTHSTPGIVGKFPASFTADVISRVLEDTVWSCAFRDEEKQSRLDQHLQACCDPVLSACRRDTAEKLYITHHECQTGATSPHPQSSRPGLDELKGEVRRHLSEHKPQTEGQRLTDDLNDIIKQFMEKVNEFQTSITTMSMTVEEQQMVFKFMVEAQDQLERNYRSKKEEHRTLEMQSYMGLNRNTGQFDPDRQVEGKIFQLGMQLEVIKEQIDRNVRCELYPSVSPAAPPLLGGVITSSPYQPAQHEESVFSINSNGHISAEEEECFKATDEEPRAADSALSCPRDTSIHLSDPLSCSVSGDATASVNMPSVNMPSVNMVGVNMASVNRAGVEGDFEDVLSRMFELRTPHRLEDVGCILQDSLEPSTNKTQCDRGSLQRYMSPETDSGLGASDRSRPPTGLSHTQHNTESCAPSDDVTSTTIISSSDNEAFRSNLQMTVSTATCAGCIQNAPVRLQFKAETQLCGEEVATIPPTQLVEAGPEEQFTTSAVRRGHSSSSCPNSDIIRALRYEVSCLRKALEDSLGYWPQPSHVSTQEKRVRGQPRPQYQHTPASSRYPNIDLIHKKVEDWMSSDMVLSKRPGPDSRESGTPAPAHVCPAHRVMHIRSRTPSCRRTLDPKCSSTDSLESMSTVTVQSRGGSYQRASVGSASHSSRASVGSTSHGTTASLGLSSHRRRVNRSNEYRPAAKRPGESGCWMDTHFPRPLHKPLLQMNYGSCYSFSSVFKTQEQQDQQSEPDVSSRRRLVQPDSVLLPSNMHFQPLHTSPCWPGGKTRTHRHSKETLINSTLDRALEAVVLLKQTTELMAHSLSAQALQEVTWSTSPQRQEKALTPDPSPVQTPHNL